MLYIICGLGWRSNLIMPVVLLCNDLYGHYYVLNYIRYYQKIANKEHECEYITQLGRQIIINKIIYTDYFLQYYLVKDC